ncbi:MAG: alpha/beta hydrolase [Myxococcota bacterium]
MRAFHPDLASRARFLPRGVARWWTLHWLQRVASPFMALAGSRATRVDLDGCGVFVDRTAAGTAPGPALLWIHGGGLMFGHPHQDGPFLARLADRLGIVVAAAQYRFAPAHPFPTPLDDCEQAWRWLVSQPDVDPTRVIIGGASAGGHLAAALCQRLRDSRSSGGTPAPMPAFQLLVYPMLDDRSARGTGPDDRQLRIWDRTSNALGWDGYLRGHNRDAPPPCSVPGRTEDLAGLPPAWIGVGTLDLFHDEDVAYARRLEEAGVDVALEIVEGAYHGFDAADERAPVSRRFREAQIAALERHLAR